MDFEYDILTAAEKSVMKCIWSHDYDMTLPDVMEYINKFHKKNWKSQTVSTFLARLVKKNILDIYRVGRHFYYRPLIAEKDYLSTLIENKTRLLFWGDKVSAKNTIEML